MASAFWTLEDGRTLARRWTGMTYMLELITRELKEIPGTKPLYAYLEKFVFREEHGDTPNGFGGFIRGEENHSPSPFFPIFPPWNSDASPPKHWKT